MPRQPRRHHQVRAAADFRVAGLPGEEGVDLPGAEPPPREPRPLHRGRGGDRHHPVHPAGAAHFQQQRHVEHRHRRAGPPRAGEERPHLPRHQRMHDRLQPRQRRGLGKRTGAQRLAREAPPAGGIGADRSREGGGDGGERGAIGRLQPVHGGVCVEHRHGGAAERPRHRRLPHAHAAGEADDAHAAAQYVPEKPTSLRTGAQRNGKSSLRHGGAANAACLSAALAP